MSDDINFHNQNNHNQLLSHVKSVFTKALQYSNLQSSTRSDLHKGLGVVYSISREYQKSASHFLEALRLR